MYGNLSAFSWVVQYLSVGVWMFSGTYQSWLCYKTKEVSGFSEYFVLCWILGAFLNTIGCFLTDQMFFQKLLGIYFLFSDSFLYLQYKYYIARPYLAEHCVQEKRKRKSHSRTQQIQSRLMSSEVCCGQTHPSDESAVSASPVTVTPGILLGLALAPLGTSAAPIATEPIPSTFNSALSWISGIFMATSPVFVNPGRSLATTSAGSQDWGSLGYLIGNTASWTSNGLYVVSRIPQIQQNYRRKSTDGVSPALFIAVLVGNAAYTLAVATAWQAISDSVEKAEFVVTEMPFIVGGIATTLADLIIFFQLYIYRKNEPEDYAILEGVTPHSETSSLMADSKKVAMYTQMQTLNNDQP